MTKKPYSYWRDLVLNFYDRDFDDVLTIQINNCAMLSVFLVAERPGVLADWRVDPGAVLRPEVLPGDRALRQGAEGRTRGQG